MNTKLGSDNSSLLIGNKETKLAGRLVSIPTLDGPCLQKRSPIVGECSGNKKASQERSVTKTNGKVLTFHDLVTVFSDQGQSSTCPLDDGSQMRPESLCQAIQNGRGDLWKEERFQYLRSLLLDVHPSAREATLGDVTFNEVVEVITPNGNITSCRLVDTRTQDEGGVHDCRITQLRRLGQCCIEGRCQFLRSLRLDRYPTGKACRQDTSSPRCHVEFNNIVRIISDEGDSTLYLTEIPTHEERHRQREDHETGRIHDCRTAQLAHEECCMDGQCRYFRSLLNF